MLKVGDILVTHTDEVEITSLDTKENGTILINGGLDENGFDMITDETGVFYEGGYNDAKNWYEIGEATIRVSTDFVYHDTSDLEAGERLYYPGSFLVGEVTDYNLTPYNTTIRVENNQIIEMHRVYDALTTEEKNRLWKLVLRKVTAYRTPDGKLSVHIYPKLPKAI